MVRTKLPGRLQDALEMEVADYIDHKTDYLLKA